MNYLVYLFYPALAVLLLVGAKFFKAGEWNETVLSYAESKSFLGFAAIMILFHHASQRTCAPWLEEFRIVHGLDVFVYVGYLFVAVFFFCSGYGMYVACKSKENFFQGFFLKRVVTILIPAVFIWTVFFIIERIQGMRISRPFWINTFDYIWFIPAIIYMYVAFYIAFHVIRDEMTGILVLLIATVLYGTICFFISPGSWWYNSIHLFVIGVFFARNREGLLAKMKKNYVPLLLGSLVVTAVFFYLASYYYQILEFCKIPYQSLLYNGLIHMWTELILQQISAMTFVLFVVLVGMKVRIGNKVLAFLGTFTLELYLVHPLFVNAFAFMFVNDTGKPIYHIRNSFFYVLVVLALSVPLAFALSSVVRMLRKKWDGK